MKKSLTILLTIFLVFASVVSVGAYTPLLPNEQVDYLFRDYYSRQTDGKQPDNVKCLEMYDCPGDKAGNEYYLICFSSTDAEKTSCFNRLGVNNEYYEISNSVNQLFPSGLAVFIGQPYNEECKDNFLSLAQLADINPLAIDYISKLIGMEYVGKIGDVNNDGEITIIDASEIKKHIAHISTFEGSNLKVADINGDEVISVKDATIIQKYIAQLIDKLG